jgi:hypothetical protein
MKCCLSLIGLLFAALLAASDCPAAAAVEKAARPARDWTAQTSVTYLPTSGIVGLRADSDIADYRLRLTRNLAINDSLTLLVGGGYGLKHIDADPLAALPQDLHALFLEVGGNYRFNDRSFVSLRITPGLYSDFKDISGDDLRMPILALGGYTFDNGISLVGGFLYRFGYHSAQYIPALGISYQPNQSWKLDLVAPRPSVTYFASRQLQFFVAGDFASDEYELKEHSLGAKAMKYSDYKAMGGFAYFPLPDVKLTTSAGYAFERRFAFYDGNRPDMRIDDVPFFRVSLDMGW